MIKAFPFVDDTDSNIPQLQDDRKQPTLKIDVQLDDCISFLKKIPDQSVDVIVTDPAYSGMNNKLQLGKGRIVCINQLREQLKSLYKNLYLCGQC